MSTWPIRVLNCHQLVVKSGHFPDDKCIHGLCVQLLELPLVQDDQLAWLKIKQGHRIYLGSLIPPVELPDSMLSFPNAVNPQPLELLKDVANYSEIGFFLVQSWLIG